MAKRALLLVCALGTAGLLTAAPAVLAQTPADPGYISPSTTVGPPVTVGGAELVRTPARAASVGGTGEARDTLPVTGSDVLALVGLGVACVVVGSVLRYRRSEQ